MIKVTGRTDGLIPGEIDRCKFFPTTIPSDPKYELHLPFPLSFTLITFVRN